MIVTGHLENMNRGNVKIIQISGHTFGVYPIGVFLYINTLEKKQNQDYTEHTINLFKFILWWAFSFSVKYYLYQWLLIIWWGCFLKIKKYICKIKIKTATLLFLFEAEEEYGQ